MIIFESVEITDSVLKSKHFVLGHVGLRHNR